jgi:hypothetical protein
VPLPLRSMIRFYPSTGPRAEAHRVGGPSSTAQRPLLAGRSSRTGTTAIRVACACNIERKRSATDSQTLVFIRAWWLLLDMLLTETCSLGWCVGGVQSGLVCWRRGQATWEKPR